MEPILSLRGIGKRFFANRVLADVSFDVAPGEIVGLVGENGAGKSTLMKILFAMPEIFETGGFEGTIHVSGCAKGCARSTAADLVLVAYGFDPKPFPPESDFASIEVNEWGGIVVDENQMTNVSGVFSGGDSVRGAQLVVHAVRDGRRAAEGIVTWLATKSGPKGEQTPAVTVRPE